LKAPIIGRQFMLDEEQTRSRAAVNAQTRTTGQTTGSRGPTRAAGSRYMSGRRHKRKTPIKVPDRQQIQARKRSRQSATCERVNS